MKVAIRDTALTGISPAQRLAHAQARGVAGLELSFVELADHVYAWIDALSASPMRISAVHTGWFNHYLDADVDTRETALDQLRQAITDAADVQADGVVFVPTYHSHEPSAEQLQHQHEMMVWLLRTNSDLAYVLGAKLLLQAAPRPHTYFMNTVSQAIDYRRIVKDHAHVWAAVHLSDLIAQAGGDEPSAWETLRTHSADVRQIYVPLDRFEALAPQLPTLLPTYQGWVTFA